MIKFENREIQDIAPPIGTSHIMGNPQKPGIRCDTCHIPATRLTGRPARSTVPAGHVGIDVTYAERRLQFVTFTHSPHAHNTGAASAAASPTNGESVVLNGRIILGSVASATILAASVLGTGEAFAATTQPQAALVHVAKMDIAKKKPARHHNKPAAHKNVHKKTHAKNKHPKAHGKKPGPASGGKSATGTSTGTSGSVGISGSLNGSAGVSGVTNGATGALSGTTGGANSATGATNGLGNVVGTVANAGQQVGTDVNTLAGQVGSDVNTIVTQAGSDVSALTGQTGNDLIHLAG